MFYRRSGGAHRSVHTRRNPPGRTLSSSPPLLNIYPQLLWLAHNAQHTTTTTHKGRLPGVLFSNPVLSSVIVSQNSLTGPLPVELSLATHLSQLVLRGNALTGTLSPHFLSSGSLSFLDMSSNDLEGSLPEALGCVCVRALCGCSGCCVADRCWWLCVCVWSIGWLCARVVLVVCVCAVVESVGLRCHTLANGRCLAPLGIHTRTR